MPSSKLELPRGVFCDVSLRNVAILIGVRASSNCCVCRAVLDGLMVFWPIGLTKKIITEVANNAVPSMIGERRALSFVEIVLGLASSLLNVDAD